MSINKKNKMFVFIVIYIMMSVLGILFVKGSQHNELIGTYTNIEYENRILSAVGYSNENGQYIKENDDPNIVLDFSDKEIYGIRINFKKPIDGNNVRFYFGRGGIGFVEADSFPFGVSNAQSIEMVDTSPFSYLRVDINEDFAIDSIEVSYEVREKQATYVEKYILVLLVNAVIIGIGFNCIERIIKKCQKTIREKVLWGIKNKKLLFIKCMQFFGCISIAIMAEIIISRLMHVSVFNGYRVFFIIAICLIVLVTIWYDKSSYKYAHIYFLAIVMLLGTTQVIVSPPVVGISWDDEVHYGRTAYLSWVTEGISLADRELISHYQSVIYNKEEYGIDGRETWVEGIDDYAVSNNQLWETNAYPVDVKYVAYIPSAIILAIGRGVGLSFTENFVLGKCVSLLIYALAISYAIKSLERGKLIAMAIGLIPTNIFLAASYSYDWCITAFVILGYALFIGDIQKGKTVSTKKFLLVMFIMLIGILPKAVYFPLVFPLMLFRKERYENSKVCRLLTVGTMFILIASFILPMLLGVNQADPRGGDLIDSGAQMRFILNQPLRYAEILLTFLYFYFSLDASQAYLTNFAYLGQAPYFTLCIVVVVICCILDNTSENKRVGKENILLRFGVLLSGFGAMVLSATALYIAFTPVAYETVLGCQYRYIIPILFPVLYFMSKMQIDINEIVKKKVINMVGLVMAFVYMNAIYLFCISNF